MNQATIGNSKNSKTKEIILFFRDIIICVLIAFLFITFVAQNAKVFGSSMYPTLENGQFLITNKLVYRFNEPKAGEIIVFEQLEEGEIKEYIKRVIGQPGDEIDIKDGYVFVNGEQLQEDYIDAVTKPLDSQVTFPVVVPENEYFVLGDNRGNSSDSRVSYVGTVPEEDIVGRATLRIWPLNKIGFVN